MAGLDEELNVFEFSGAAAKARSIDPRLRVLITGHTHNPRIIVDASRRAGPLVLMDCGGWVERSTVEGGGSTYEAASAHVGVQCGNELRIYQIGAAVRV